MGSIPKIDFLVITMNTKCRDDNQLTSAQFIWTNDKNNDSYNDLMLIESDSVVSDG